MKRWTAIVALITIIVGILPMTGCSKKQESANSVSLGSVSGSVAGLKWSVPKRWTTQGERPMRAATYAVPPAEGDTEQGECAVFYFGTGQGGDVDANIERWVGQFEPSAPPAKVEREINGMKVAMVQIAGAYLSPGGPMMQSTEKKENYRLLGAIVQGPQGSVFYKFTGPAKTIGAAHEEFDAMVGSLVKI